MKMWSYLFWFYFKRTIKDGFTIGYSIIFPLVMITLLGFLLKNSYGAMITGFQYYAIVLLPFCILCEIITAAYLGQEEARKKVAERFLVAPVSEKMIVGTKLLAGTCALSVCHGIVMIIATLVWQVDYGTYGFLIFIQYTVLTSLSFAIGLWMGLGMKNFIVIKNFMNLPIFLFAIMGGCFYPIGSLNKLFDSMLKLSPLTWINRGSFLSIYDGDSFVLVVVIGCLAVVGILCGIGAMITFKKEDFLYGDLLNSHK